MDEWIKCGCLVTQCDSLRPHGLEHTRFHCPSLSPGVYSKSCPLSQWCHQTLLYWLLLLPPSIIPSIRVFNWVSFSPSGSQNTGVSASASALPMNIQDWFPLGLTGSISLQSKGLSSLLQHHSSKASILRNSAFFIVQLSHLYMTTGKTIALTRWTFVGKVTKLCNMLSQLCNMLSRLVIAFLPGNKSLLISWLQSHSAVILEPPKIKSVTVSCFPIYLPWSDGTGCHDLSFLNVEL